MRQDQSQNNTRNAKQQGLPVVQNVVINGDCNHLSVLALQCSVNNGGETKHI